MNKSIVSNVTVTPITTSAIEAIKEAKRIRQESNQNGYGGTTTPGKEALKIEPNILSIISQNTKTIMVSGTNGKTTVTSMIMHLLKASGIKSFSNKEGANMLEGITTAFLLNTDDTGHCKYPIAVIECDECYVEQMAMILQPEVLVITNLYDDQTERLINAEHTAKKLEKAIENMPYSTVCLNRQSVYCQRFMNKANCSILFQSNEPGKITVGDKEYSLSLNTFFDFQYENIAAAVATLYGLGIWNEECLESLKQYREPFGRCQSFIVNNLPVTIILVKNKKAMELIFPVLTKTPKKADLILGYDDPYDMIWIDQFGKKEKQGFRVAFDQIYTSGKCRENVAKVLNSDYPSEKQAAILADSNDFINLVYKRERPLYIITGYYYLLKINTALHKEGLIPAFWE